MVESIKEQCIWATVVVIVIISICSCIGWCWYQETEVSKTAMKEGYSQVREGYGSPIWKKVQ